MTTRAAGPRRRSPSAARSRPRRAAGHGRRSPSAAAASTRTAQRRAARHPATWVAGSPARRKLCRCRRRGPARRSRARRARTHRARPTPPTGHGRTARNAHIGLGLPASGPLVSDRGITFRLADADRRYAAVRLGQELHLPDDARTLARVPGGWELRLDRPPVARMEYRFEVMHADGTMETVPDPANPRGVVELPGYREPAWLATPAAGGARRELAVRAPALGAEVHATLWSPAGLDDTEAAPLLLVHDGPEYDRAARLTHYLAAGVAEGRLPPLRAALLEPGERDDRYSANPAYASDLATAVVPALAAVSPATTTIGMGTSLGALAHAPRPPRAPGARRPAVPPVRQLLRPAPRRPRVVASPATTAWSAFVGAVREAGGAARPVPTVLTCGGAEENVHNNRLLAATLAAQGYDVALHEVDDVHNWTAWRDALEPHLTGLIASAD